MHMFSGINTIDVTNDIMEEFYEHLTEYKECDDDDKRLYAYDEIDADDFEQLFGLKVDGNLICVCRILIPIIEHIAKEIDLVQTNWQIVPLKIN
jgi:predicted GNAT family N-acyltransferase